MYYVTQNNIRSKQTTKKFAVLAFLMCLCFIMFFLSGVLVLTHLNHKHDHIDVDNSCTICAQIQNAESLIKQFGLVIDSMSFSSISLFIMVILYPVSFLIRLYTPIDLKVCMNN